MPALLAAVALGLMAYFPGRSSLRLLGPSAGIRPGERTLVELLLGNAIFGLVGFGLAEAGVFSLTALLAALALVWAATAIAGRGRPPLPSAAGGDALGVALAAAALLWVLPPFETALWAHDSSVYASGGLSLARNGTLAFPDPTLAAMDHAQRAAFFPPYVRAIDTPPYIRLAGGLLLTDLDEGVVLPAFHHLLLVWVGAAWAIAGDAALGAPASYFGALALWAIAAFTFRLGGWAAAVATTLLMIGSAPQYWYSRFLMPEVPSQYFLWAGLLTAGASLAAPASRLGMVAGLGLGVAGLMRLDGLAHTIAALALFRAVSSPSAWPAGAGFLPALGGLTLWTAAHQVLFPTHYYSEAFRALAAGWWRLRAAFAGVIAFPMALSLGSAAARTAAIGVFLAYGLATIVSTRPDFSTSLGWMTSYVGWPGLLAGALGSLLWWRRAGDHAERYALLLGWVVLCQLSYDPRVTPAPLWAVRRFVPVAIPLLLIGAGLVSSALWRRNRLLGALAVLVCLAGTGSRSVLAYRGEAFHDSMEHVRSLLTLLPADAVVAVDPALGVRSQVHIALWAAGGRPTYLIPAALGSSFDTLGNALRGRPLYWLGGDDPASLAAIATRADLVASYRFATGVRRLDWYGEGDEALLQRPTLWLYRLRPATPSAGAEEALH